jgi:anthranilate synthase/aminodeoxychorismate synthase-like glutamine amidotransferase
MIVLIDNYDSFVYNLARYFGQLGYERSVVRNDELTVNDIKKLNPSHIVISPGPCTPNEAGISLQVIHELGSVIPILGICLGHQAIAQAYGGRVVSAKKPMHGKASQIQHNERGVFSNIANLLTVGRYHSLAVADLPACLEVTATSEDGEIMAIQHREHCVVGLQFHPESVLTESGYDLLRNFLMLSE